MTDNLSHNVYPEALSYLTQERGLDLDVLKMYKIGLGTERFVSDETNSSFKQPSYVGFDSVYFPIYSPKKGGKTKSQNRNDI